MVIFELSPSFFKVNTGSMKRNKGSVSHLLVRTSLFELLALLKDIAHVSISN